MHAIKTEKIKGFKLLQCYSETRFTAAEGEEWRWHDGRCTAVLGASEVGVGAGRRSGGVSGVGGRLVHAGYVGGLLQ